MNTADTWKEVLDNAVSEARTDVARTVFEQLLREIEREQIDENGFDMARRLTGLSDAIVTLAYERSTSKNMSPHALVALGGFGRREMAPYSDIALLFLFRTERDKSPEFISGVLHPLWDLGTKTQYSSSSPTLKRALADCAIYKR